MTEKESLTKLLVQTKTYAQLIRIAVNNGLDGELRRLKSEWESFRKEFVPDKYRLLIVQAYWVEYCKRTTANV